MTMSRQLHSTLAVSLVFIFSVHACAAGPDKPQLPVGSSLGEPIPARMLPSRVPQLPIAGDPVQGEAGAPVTIVEFIDYQCPYCQGFAKDTYPKLKATYIDTGKVRYVARDFPLAKHGRARPAAIAAACAREQGRFWEMHDALLAEAGQLADADFRRHADRLGLDRARFDACLGEARHRARLDADVAAAQAMGVSGTPSFLVGGSRDGFAAGRLLQGDETYDEFVEVLAGYLGPEK
jgi:protein-disulfide isomerase